MKQRDTDPWYWWWPALIPVAGVLLILLACAWRVTR